MNQDLPFLPLLLITLLAAAIPLITSRIKFIRLPVVVGEIIAGMVVGQSGLNLVPQSDIIDFLAEFGFIVLMFLSGLEIDFNILFGTPTEKSNTPRWQQPIYLAGIVFSLSVVLAVITGGAIVLAGLASNAVLMGLILSTTSLGVVLPVLKERKMTGTAYGQVLLACTVISDFVTLLLLTIAVTLFSQGLNLSTFFFAILLAAFPVAAWVGRWAVRSNLFTRIVEELSHATSQLRVRGAFVLMIGWIVLSQALGVEVILGAFLAGAIVSISRRSHESSLSDKLDAIGFGFFIPVFFIMVGIRFDLRALFASPSALLLVPIMLVAAYFVKLLPALLFHTRFSWRESLAGGFLISSRLSMIIAASAIALDMNLLSQATNSAIILVAVVTCTVSPVLFSKILAAKEPQARHGVIIFGTGPLARALAARLHKYGESITFLSRDYAQLESLRQEGFSVVHGDPLDSHTLEQAQADEARALVAIPTSPDIVLDVCRQAHSRFNIPIVVARSDDPAHIHALQAARVRVIQPATTTAMALEGALHFPASFDMLMDGADDVDVMDALLLNTGIAGKALKRIHLPGNVLVLGIRRDGELIVPHGNTVARQGDILMLVGSADALDESLRLLGSNVV